MQYTACKKTLLERKILKASPTKDLVLSFEKFKQEETYFSGKNIFEGKRLHLFGVAVQLVGRKLFVSCSNS